MHTEAGASIQTTNRHFHLKGFLFYKVRFYTLTLIFNGLPKLLPSTALCSAYQMHPVASSPQGDAARSIGGAFCGRCPESSMCICWKVAGGSRPGQPEGALVDLLTLGVKAQGGVPGHRDRALAVVPGALPLLRLVVGGGFGEATAEGVRGLRGLAWQAALLLVVHEGFLVGPGHRADHLLLAAVRRAGRGRAGAGVHRRGGFWV